MKPIEIKNGDKTTTNIGRIINPALVISTEDTILSDEFVQNGFTIPFDVEIQTLTGPATSLFLVPCAYTYIDQLICIDEIAYSANSLLRVYESFKTGERSLQVLNKAIFSYQSTLASRISGKSGVFNRYVLGRRFSGTGRAVLQVSEDERPEIVFIPRKNGIEKEISDGDPVLIGRDPTIWYGSFECLIAKLYDGDCIKINPLIYPQLGADNDGDTVWFMSIPKEFHEQAKVHSSPFFSHNHRHSISADIGQTVSPIDYIEDKDSNIANLEFKTSRKLKDESLSIINNRSPVKFVKEIININDAMLIQKLYLGPVGAACQKIKLLASKNKDLSSSANYISERAQQLLFDVKGVTTAENKQLNNFFEMLDILNISGKYGQSDKVIPFKDILSKMEEIGFDLNEAQYFLAYLYVYVPFYRALSELGLLNEETTNIIKNFVYDSPHNSKAIYKQLLESLSITKNTLDMAWLRARKSITLSDLVSNAAFKITTITNPVAAPIYIQSLDSASNSLDSQIYHLSKGTA